MKDNFENETTEIPSLSPSNSLISIANESPKKHNSLFWSNRDHV